MDFVLDSYLGYAISQYGHTRQYIIVSADKGYDIVCRFWKNRGYNVCRRAAMPHVKEIPVISLDAIEKALDNLPEKKKQKFRNLCLSYVPTKKKNYFKFSNAVYICLKNNLKKKTIRAISQYIFYNLYKQKR